MNKSAIATGCGLAVIGVLVAHAVWKQRQEGKPDMGTLKAEAAETAWQRGFAYPHRSPDE